jgi:hypothetical protein
VGISLYNKESSPVIAAIFYQHRRHAGNRVPCLKRPEEKIVLYPKQGCRTRRHVPGGAVGFGARCFFSSAGGDPLFSGFPV